MALQFAGKLRPVLYTQDDLNHFAQSKYIERFLSRKAAINRNTAQTYKVILTGFAAFVRNNKKQGVDAVIDSAKNGSLDPYDLISEYGAFLAKSRQKTRISPNTIRNFSVVVKKFLRVSGVRINTDDFKDLVSLPRIERADKKALERKDVIDILNACKDMELKVYLLLLASTAGRAVEVASLRIKDVKLDDEYPSVTFRKEFTKTRQARRIPLTKEAANQLKVWLRIKYEPHRTTITDNGKERQEFVSPETKLDDLVFGRWSLVGIQQDPSLIASRLRAKTGKLLTAIDKGQIDDSGKRREFTLHSFRRFVKTVIANHGYSDYSEWFLGHNSGIRATYFRQSEKESAEIFHKIEPSLTFLDATKLEEYHADISSKLQELADKNNDLRKKDDLSQDAIKALSDALTELKEEVRQLKEEKGREQQQAVPVMTVEQAENKPRKQIRQ